MNVQVYIKRKEKKIRYVTKLKKISLVPSSPLPTCTGRSCVSLMPPENPDEAHRVRRMAGRVREEKKEKKRKRGKGRERRRREKRKASGKKKRSSQERI